MEVIGANYSPSPCKWCQGCSQSSSPSSSFHSKVSLSSTAIKATLSVLLGGVTQILIPEGKKIFNACHSHKKVDTAVLKADKIDYNLKMEVEKQ